MIDEKNFFIKTTATFTPCRPPKRKADYKSASGSLYWYFDDHIVRQSSHWGKYIGSCNWFIEGEGKYPSMHDFKGKRAGRCKWSDFKEGKIWIVAYGRSLPEKYQEKGRFDTIIKTGDIKNGRYWLFGKPVPAKDLFDVVLYDHY